MVQFDFRNLTIMFGFKLKVFHCLTLIISILSTIEGFKDFKGFQVIRVIATKADQLELLKNLYEDDINLDFWTKPSLHRGTDIMVSLDRFDSLKELLISKGIHSTVMIQDIQKMVAEQRRANTRAELLRGDDFNITWDNYQTVETISNWLDKLGETYPKLCTVETIGQSTEGRPLKLIRISSNDINATQTKISIWIDGGIHAREWISPATVTYMINELVTKSDLYSDLLSNFDFYVLPVINPDGYEYTWTTDRMWRKTRSIHSLERGCKGVDPNRNFGYKYGGSGTSSDECSEIYRGPTAFSEPETKALSDYILKSSTKFLGYFTIHSYSQVWVYPWGYASELPSDWKELDAVARLGAEEIRKKHGTVYICGSSTNVLYAAAGGSDDWAKGTANIKYSFTIELRDTGRYGFMLPPNQIGETAEETWSGIQAALGKMLATG